jgi:hypothetical protein
MLPMKKLSDRTVRPIVTAARASPPISMGELAFDPAARKQRAGEQFQAHQFVARFATVGCRSAERCPKETAPARGATGAVLGCAEGGSARFIKSQIWWVVPVIGRAVSFGAR